MRCSSGFTLLEVMVALAIGGMVVLTAERLFAAVGDAQREVAQARQALDRAANARRWLAAAFLSLEAGPGSAGSFAGERSRVSFSTWQQSETGWFVPRRVTLGLAGNRLVAASQNGDFVTLADSVGALDCDYLLEPGLDAHWIREWISGVSAPLAVRMRIARAGEVDTLLFLIKERG